MKETYLVQRLKKPKGIANPFSFGGGLKYGGLTKEAADIVSKIWAFDYMGASEFEHGAVQKALYNIFEYSQTGSAVTGKIELTRNVLYLCEKKIKKDVEATITGIAQDSIRLMERALLKEAIEQPEYFKDYHGWLELDNGFMFFVDEEMFNKSLNLFGINSSLQ